MDSSISIDMKSWPLLRLDQIPFISSTLLKDSVSALCGLYEDESPELVYLSSYISRQKSRIAQVLSQRENDKVNIDRLYAAEKCHEDLTRSESSNAQSLLICNGSAHKFMEHTKTESLIMARGSSVAFIVSGDHRVHRRLGQQKSKNTSLTKEQELERNRQAHRTASIARINARRSDIRASCKKLRAIKINKRKEENTDDSCIEKNVTISLHKKSREKQFCSNYYDSQSSNSTIENGSVLDAMDTCIRHMSHHHFPDSCAAQVKSNITIQTNDSEAQDELNQASVSKNGQNNFEFEECINDDMLKQEQNAIDIDLQIQSDNDSNSDESQPSLSTAKKDKLSVSESVIHPDICMSQVESSLCAEVKQIYFHLESVNLILPNTRQNNCEVEEDLDENFVQGEHVTDICSVPVKSQKKPFSSPKDLKLTQYASVYPVFGAILSTYYSYAPIGQDGRCQPIKNRRLFAENEKGYLADQIKLYTKYWQIMQDHCVPDEFVLPTDSQSGNCSRTFDQLEMSRSVMFKRSPDPAQLHYRISSRHPEGCNIVYDVMNKAFPNWTELPEGLGLSTSWNLLWTQGKQQIDYNSLLVWQKVNHYPHSRELTRKDLLKQHLTRTMNISGKHYKEFYIMPLTFVLPQDYSAFVAAFTSTEEEVTFTGGSNGAQFEDKNLWIMKPVGMSRGRGIQLINDISEVKYSDQVVIQRYVEKPFLLNGYKFDLRLYVLVTSFNPLEAFLYDEGFARVCTRKYTTKNEFMDDVFVHLTNSSVQKRNEEETAKDSPLNLASPGESGGTKMSLSSLWKLLSNLGVSVSKLNTEIVAVIVKSLVACQCSIPFQPNSFEFFGFDILIDENLTPWLIEVNASPQLDRDTDLDKRVKEGLVKDTINLVLPPAFNRVALIEALRQRLTSQHQTKSDNRCLFEVDLSKILKGVRPRQYGEMPVNLGAYSRICPGLSVYDKIVGLSKTNMRGEL